MNLEDEKEFASRGLADDHEEAVRERVSDIYAQAALRLQDLIHQNGQFSTYFAGVNVLGSPHTRISFIRRIIHPLLNPHNVFTFQTSLNELAKVAEKFERLGIYETVSVDVDNSDNGEGLEATIHLKERSRLWARTGTDFGNQEGNAYASFNARNVFGGAESVEASLSVGTRTKTSYELRLSTPVLADPDTIFELTGYQATRNNTYASHDEIQQGILAKLKHIGRYGTHELSIGAIDRHITNLTEGVSLAVRECAGITRKISVLHSFTRDQRDDHLMPNTGYRIRTTQELAGRFLGGSASFVKLEADASKYFSLSPRTTLSLSSKSGILLSDNAGSQLSDRFQLGGPQNVRSFMYNGLGPRAGRDSLGGDIYLACGISLLTPVPKAPTHWPIRFHTFINSGSLLPMTNKLPLRQLLTEPSISTGFGLVFRHPIARIEVSASMPIVARLGDRTRKGVSFGLGVDFM